MDGTTSVVTGSGSSGDPFQMDILDPLFYSQRYGFRRQRTTNQNIPNDTPTFVDFTAAQPGSFDRGPFFSAPSTFIIPTTGLYAFGATVGFADNALGTREVQIVKNGSVVVASNETNSNAGSVHYVTVTSSDIFLELETIQLQVRHVATAALDIVFNGEQSPVMWAVYLGRKK